MAIDSKALQQAAKITARQMDHWYRRGWLLSFDRNANEGSGVPLEWPLRTVRKAILMGHLTRAGFKPELANQIAEADLKRPEGVYPFKVRIGEVLVLTITGV